MEQVLDSFQIPEMTALRCLIGFDIERSKDNTKLFIPTSGKEEQAFLLKLLSQLDENVGIKDAESQSLNQLLIVPQAEKLIRKIQKAGIEVGLDTSEAINCIVTQMKNGIHLKYRSYQNSEYRLEIRGFKREDSELQKLVEKLSLARINVAQARSDNMMGNYVYDSSNGEETVILLQGYDALSIAKRVAQRGANFDGGRYLADLQQSISH